MAKMVEGPSALMPNMAINTKWTQRFPQQFRALFYKNMLQSIRNWKATTIRVLAPFIFLFLALIIDKALQTNREATEEFKVRRTTDTELIKNIPKCEEDVFFQGDCQDFFYTVQTLEGVSTESAKRTIDKIVSRVRSDNDPPIPEHKTRYFDSPSEVNEWFLANPEKSLGAVHFVVSNEGKWIDYTLQTNSTVKYFKGRFQDPNMFFQIPFQNAIHRAIALHFYEEKNGNTDGLSWTLGWKEYPHPAFESNSIAGALLGPFLFAANMFGVVTQINAMTSEKQEGIKQALRTMGMLDSAYWTSWAAWELCLNLVTSLLNVAFGCMFQFSFFLDNNFFLLFFLLFLFQMSMVSFGFVLVSLINKVVVATMMGFVVFVAGWSTYIVQQFGIPYTSEYFTKVQYVTVIFTMLPWNVFMKGVGDLSAATSNSESNGLSFGRRFSYCRDEDNSYQCENEAANSDDYIDCECVMALGHIYWVLIILVIGYLLMAVYLEKVVPNEFGIWLHPLYFLDPRYWGYKIGYKPVLKILANNSSVQREIDEDVKQEMARMKEQVVSEEGKEIPESKGNPVELFGLQKRFAKNFAVNGSWFCINEGELFCLLGPNGAGKTTTINVLTGAFPPSGGAAFVYGNSITEPGGMEKIRSMMGVCPQFDVLWKDLTGMEHLWIFGMIKGIPTTEVGHKAEESLNDVALTHAANQKSLQYSGGMKRRLSVAIALLGDPKIVFLDEPTTGMDPISRRFVWDIIQKAKPGRAIVLTTHSMEEADILGDRIAIMARGDVRVLGTSIRLKQKYGAGYAISVPVPTSTSTNETKAKVDKIKEFFHKTIDVSPKEENKAYITFLIPREKEEELNNFLTDLESNKATLGITDINLQLTTLEEVFLGIAKKAEIDNLSASGVTRTNVHFTDGTMVSIDLGQNNFTHPCGVEYSVQWDLTADGTLQITDAVPIGDVPEGAPFPNV